MAYVASKHLHRSGRLLESRQPVHITDVIDLITVHEARGTIESEAAYLQSLKRDIEVVHFIWLM